MDPAICATDAKWVLAHQIETVLSFDTPSLLMIYFWDQKLNDKISEEKLLKKEN